MFKKTVSVKLSAPLEWEDRKILTIELDFGKISGALLNKCERESSGNLTAAIRQISTEYTSRMASMISNVPFRAIEKMSCDDFELICAIVQKYLLKEDPQEYYDDYIKGEMGFTEPAALPEMASVGSTAIS
jgi:formate dehydrogenase maturation protein FdhE